MSIVMLYYVVSALAGLAAVLTAVVAWARYHSSSIVTRAEQVQALQANTTAVQDLTKRLDQTSNTIAEHEKRLWILEFTRKHDHK